MNKKVYAVILGGGKGTRLNCTDIPKVLIKLNNKPMIRYVLDATKKVASDIVVITGFQGEKLQSELSKSDVKFAHQAEQLGTGHALMQAEKELEGKDGITLVVNGDGPLFTPEVFETLISEMQNSNHALVFSSIIEDEHPAYGRVLRNEKGNVVGTREAKDATDEEKKIREKIVGIYAIDNRWLWPALKKMKKSSVSGEYYITDLIKIALDDGRSVEAVPVADPEVVKGINTPEELLEVEDIINNRKS